MNRAELEICGDCGGSIVGDYRGGECTCEEEDHKDRDGVWISVPGQPPGLKVKIVPLTWGGLLDLDRRMAVKDVGRGRGRSKPKELSQ